MSKVVLTTPINKPSITEYSIVSFEINVKNMFIRVTLEANNGEHLNILYQDENTQQLIEALNVANLSIKSLRVRLIERLVADGHVPPGTIN
jgi:hypothetical protein